MMQRSDFVIRGNVISTESQWKENSRGMHIYTQVTVHVLDKIKGDVEDDILAFETIGGVVGDIREIAGGAAVFEMDQEVIVFLAGQPLTVLSGARGKIAVSDGHVDWNGARIWADDFIQTLKILEQDPNAPVSWEEARVSAQITTAAECYIDSGYKWSGTSPLINYRIYENTPDCTGEGAAVQAAATTWNNVGANFTFQYNGTHTNTSSSRNYVNEVMWGTTGEDALAETTYWVQNSTTIVECDIVFNEVRTWSSTTPSAGQYDIQSVALHEFGHWFSLDDLYDPADSDNIMYGYGSAGEIRRTLQTCDIEGFCSIYGGCSIYADLYDDGESYRSFAPTTIQSGQTFLISADIRNGGIIDCGSFVVKFYASADTTISASDYYIGQCSIAGITAGNRRDCDLTCTFPASIPAGVYWVGWIIDANNNISESNEDNNTAYKLGYQLNVLAGTVSQPTFAPAGGSYTSAQQVTITCSTAGATIRYTIDGTDPAEDDTAIASGSSVIIGQSLTLKAKAWKTDYAPSAVKTATYTITAAESASVIEGFETGGFGRYPWLRGGDALWTAVLSEGSYAAVSGNVDDSQQSILQLTCNIPTADTIRFDRKVSSEEDYDFLCFYIDGVKTDQWSGTLDWQEVSYEIAPGQHSFIWAYEKDGSLSVGSDCVWIDNIILNGVAAAGIQTPDFNTDGTTDLLWENTSNSANYITLMGGGIRGPFQYIPDSTGGALEIEELADFDGNGTTDLLWENISTSANYITLMNGGVRGSFLYIANSTGGTLEIVDIADFDGDGTMDLLWENISTSANFITLVNGGIRGPFQYIADSTGGTLEIADLADFDGNGTADLLWENISTSANFITLMNGGVRGPFLYIADSKGGTLEIVDLADFDGDETADLLWENTSTSANFITLMNGGVRGPFQYIPDSAGGTLEIADIGDFNGDGKMDLLWELGSTSANFITLMNGGVRGPFQYIADSAGGTLEIIKLADFDGNGMTDLLWENTSTSANYITLMNGTVRGTFQYLPDSTGGTLEILDLPEE